MKLLMIALGSVIAAPAFAAPACPQGLHPATTAELFFGRDVGEQVGVSDADWRQFVDQEVSPRFASGRYCLERRLAPAARTSAEFWRLAATRGGERASTGGGRRRLDREWSDRRR